MKERIAVLLIKILPKGIKNKVKKTILKFKSKNPKLLTLLNGTFDDEDIIKEFERRNPNIDFDILMVHSSFNNLRPMYKGNIGRLLNSLIEYSEKKNITIVMPAFMLGKNNEGVKEYYSKKGKQYNKEYYQRRKKEENYVEYPRSDWYKQGNRWIRFIRG